MAMSSRIELRNRHRTRRAATERQILEAAERLLRERPYRDLTVDDVMAAAGQSRTAFYRHFRDRQDLVIRLLNELGAEFYELAGAWLVGTGDPRAEGRKSTELLVEAWAQQGPLLRAISEAASHDEEVETAYRALVQMFIDASAGRLEREAAAYGVAHADVRETAIALCWMTERYLSVTFATPGAGDPAVATEVLHAIWMRAAYRLEPAE